MASVRPMLLVLALYLALPIYLAKTVRNWEAESDIVDPSQLRDGDYSKLMEESVVELDASDSVSISRRKREVGQEPMARLEARLCRGKDLDKLTELAQFHVGHFKEFAESEQNKRLMVCLKEKLDLLRDKSTDINGSDKKSIQFSNLVDILYGGREDEEQYPNLVDELVIELKPSDSTFTGIEGKYLVHLQSIARLDLQLCNGVKLDYIMDLGQFFGSHFKKYVRSRRRKLLVACVASASDALSKKLHAKDDSNGLNKMIKFVRSCNQDPAGNGVYIKNLVAGYNRDQLISYIVRHMNIMSKNDNSKPWKYSIYNRKESKATFIDLYEKYVLGMCRDWDSATDQLHKVVSYYTDRLKRESLTKQQIGWLNYRQFCDEMFSDRMILTLRESVYERMKVTNWKLSCLWE